MSQFKIILLEWSLNNDYLFTTATIYVVIPRVNFAHRFDCIVKTLYKKEHLSRIKTGVLKHFLMATLNIVFTKSWSGLGNVWPAKHVNVAHIILSYFIRYLSWKHNKNAY